MNLLSDLSNFSLWVLVINCYGVRTNVSLVHDHEELVHIFL